MKHVLKSLVIFLTLPNIICSIEAMQIMQLLGYRDDNRSLSSSHNKINPDYIATTVDYLPNEADTYKILLDKSQKGTQKCTKPYYLNTYEYDFINFSRHQYNIKKLTKIIQIL